MTFRDAMKADKRLIWHSLGFSGTIVMEGYGYALITYLFSFYTFNEKYGVVLPGKFVDGKPVYELEYIWKALLPLVAQFGSLIGIMITAPITRKLGYRRTTQLMLVWSAAFVCMPFFASSVQVLLMGFLIQGIPWGVYQVVSPAYASEVASLQLRPILTTWNNLCWVIGQLIASAILKGFEKYPGDMSFRIPFAFQWVFLSMLMIVISFAPESPYWHLQRQRIPEARATIRKLVRHGSADTADRKLALMQHTMHQESKKEGAAAEAASSWKRFTGMFKGVDARRTEIACMAWLIQSMCGSSIIPWAPKLFESAGLAASQALSVNIALPAAGIMGTVASWWLMRIWGRRQIYFWGQLIMGVFLVGVGLASLAPDNISGWIAGGILTVYTAIYDLTIGPVCYSIVSEIPSIRRRAATLSAARGTYLIAGLVNHFLTPKMVGIDEASWKWGAKTGFLYAGMCVLGAVYTWYRIPETTGLSARALDILFQHKISAREFNNDKAAAVEATDREKAAAEAGSRTSDVSIMVHEIRTTDKA
ncbi:general substrate transporter [Lasiosphaeria miniovina]|uniref:General substrate transporter n=1 Tax=Lasiosphaeria miniovina TaxID=1954250 RepID=A0AA40E2Y2_9PEZI|nr:general substrate transporter [Lasiosphaeria miniovina]KAK0723037.1 general substrate transporter [Lasiosphaeria miniovina]